MIAVPKTVIKRKQNGSTYKHKEKQSKQLNKTG